VKVFRTRSGELFIKACSYCWDHLDRWLRQCVEDGPVSMYLQMLILLRVEVRGIYTFKLMLDKGHWVIVVFSPHLLDSRTETGDW